MSNTVSLTEYMPVSVLADHRLKKNFYFISLHFIIPKLHQLQSQPINGLNVKAQVLNNNVVTVLMKKPEI